MVVGYDDIPATGWGSFDLTSFDQDIPALVDATLDLVASMTGAQDDTKRRLVPPKLVLRSSTRKP